MGSFGSSLIIIGLATIACIFGPACAPSWAQDWTTVKESLAARGIIPSVIYDLNMLSNVDGGLKRDTILQGNAYLNLRIDSEKFFGFPGLKINFSELGTNGPNPAGIVGDAQGVSNMTVPPGFRSYEGWLQYNFFDNRWSVLVGQYDLGTEFYRLQTAGLFFNYAFGTGTEFGLSGVEGPSIFPFTSLGTRIAFRATDNFVIRTAILDGVPLYRPGGAISPFHKGDGLLIVSEAAWSRRPPPDDPAQGHRRIRIGRFSDVSHYDDKVAVGAWHYTAKFSDLSEFDTQGIPLLHQGSSGAYLAVDRVLSETADHKHQIGAFLQLGVAEQQVNRFGSYIGAGITAGGLIAGRPNDEIGIGVASARNGFSYMESQQQMGLPVNRAETAIEAAYLAKINDSVAWQPDFQYVIHPNTDPTVSNASVFQLRLELQF
jgi:porin